MRDRLGAGGPLLAAAGALVTVAVLAVDGRMEAEWDGGTLLLLNAAAAVVVLGAGFEAARSEGRPDGPATALLVAGLVLALIATVALADVLGADGDEASIGFTALGFAAIAAGVGWARSSPVALLMAAVALMTACVAAVVGLFEPDGIDAFRWLFLVLAIVFALAAWRVEPIDKHRSVQLVNAAGLATLALAGMLTEAIGFPFVAFAEGGSGVDTPLGWEIVSLAASGALLAYAIVRREPGPAYIGVFSIVYFLGAIALSGDEGTLAGWPLVLVVVAAVAIVAALAMPAKHGPEVEPRGD